MAIINTVTVSFVSSGEYSRGLHKALVALLPLLMKVNFRRWIKYASFEVINV